MRDSSQTKIRVLHVDDDSSLLELTETFLQRQDSRITVETATSPDEGLQRISKRRPDCLLSDYDMPNMNGVEFLQTVREEHPNLPFILFTGKGSEEVASEAISAGVTDYLQKGSGSEQYELLANRIENAVEAQREAQRAERQGQLMRLTEFVGDTGGWEVFLDTDKMVLTPGMRQLLGLECREISFERFLELCHHNDRDKVRAAVDATVESRGQMEDTWRLRSTENTHLRVDVNMTSVVIDEEVTKVRGALADITEREQREQRLSQYRDLLESINDAVFVVDQDRRIVYANQQSLDNVGLTSQEVDSEPIMPFVERYATNRSSVTEFEQALTTALDDSKNETPDSVELAVATDDSKSVYEHRFSRVSTRSNVVDGTVSKAVAIVSRDITNQKKRISTLEQTETLFENTQDMLFIIKCLGKKFVVERVNQAFEAATGLSNGDLQGKTPQELFGEKRGKEIERKYRQCVQNKEPLSYRETLAEDQVPNKESPTDDGIVYWETHITPVEMDGEVDYIVGATRDINEQIRREQRLKRRNDRLDEVTSIIGHDLRNPLNVAETRLELVRSDIDNEHLAEVADALDRCQTLVDDTFSLAQHGDQIGESDPLDISDAATRSWQTVLTASAELTIETNLTLQANRSSLQQLFENLYRNAIEHGGTDVTVRVGEMDDGFFVADTGPGIPESDREDVFETDHSTADGGTGFGLRIVEQIAHAHDWEVVVTESRQGGARFEFTGVEKC